ncbi:MAG TPA: hypothetical protein VK666_24060 [Chryseolinea sp.]|nr:hypothetical protein [Chryseolinea sp.]
MNRLLLFSFLLLSAFYSYAQTGYLFVKKGASKKRTYVEGSTIYLRLKDESFRYGLITRLMNDTIYVSGSPVPISSVSDVLLRNPTKDKGRFHIDGKQLLLITGGVALVTTGLTLSKQASFKKAITAGTVIGYGPLALGYLRSKITFRRKKFSMGKKFRLQVLDFYIPKQRAF